MVLTLKVPFDKIKFNHPAILQHIKNFKLKKDGTVSGLHYYRVPENYQSEKIESVSANIKIFKMYPNLWVITNHDINDFHEAYILYNGEIVDQKSCCPCNWSEEKLKSQIGLINLEKEIVEHAKKRYEKVVL